MYLCADDALCCLVLEPLEEVAVFRRLVVKRRLVRQAHLLRHHLPRHVNIHAYVTVSQYTPARKVQRTYKQCRSVCLSYSTCTCITYISFGVFLPVPFRDVTNMLVIRCNIEMSRDHYTYMYINTHTVWNV